MKNFIKDHANNKTPAILLKSLSWNLLLWSTAFTMIILLFSLLLKADGVALQTGSIPMRKVKSEIDGVSNKSPFYTEDTRNEFIQKGAFEWSSDSSESLYRPTPDGVTFCRYFNRINKGTNPKFRCYWTDSNGHYFYVNKKGQVPQDAYSEESRVDDQGNLISSNGQKIGTLLEIKVKYYPLPWALKNIRAYQPRHNQGPESRYRDFFTEIAATYLLKKLGYPVDSMWPTQSVHCFGCPLDPYNQKSDVTLSDGSPKLYDLDFKHAAVEIQFPGKKIESKETRLGQGWNWKEVSDSVFGNVEPENNDQRKRSFEALLVFLAVFNHLSNDPEQQRVVCAKVEEIQLRGNVQSEKLSKVCTKPLLMVQDLGATFGHEINTRQKYEKSKGSLLNWKTQKVFSNGARIRLPFHPISEDLKSALFFTISESGLQYSLDKLMKLTYEEVYNIFKYSKIDIGDIELTKEIMTSLKSQNPSWDESRLHQETRVVALTKWTEAWFEKVNEIKSVYRQLKNSTKVL